MVTGQSERPILTQADRSLLKTLDRYVIREILPPFFLALGVFTFVLAVQPMLLYAQNLLAKNVPLHTVGFLLLTLLPQSLGVTIPMALLAGLLMALGRLSGDREAVALLACGVSPLRLLRPILIFTVVVGLADLYVMVEAVPNGNQRFREVTFHLLAQQTDSDIKPGLFYEGFPGKVLFVGGNRPGGGWSGVFLADTSQPGRPVVTLAESGQLSLDSDKHEVDMWLYQARRYMPGADPHGLRRLGDDRAAAHPDSGRLGLRHWQPRPGPPGDVHRGPPEGDRRRSGQRRHRARPGHVPPPEVLVPGRVPGVCVDRPRPGTAHAEGRQARGPDARAGRHLHLLRPARAGRDPHQGRSLLARVGPLVPEHRPGRGSGWSLLWRRERASGAALAIPAAFDRFWQWLAPPEERRSPERRRASSWSFAFRGCRCLRARGCSTCTSGPSTCAWWPSPSSAFLGLYYIGTVIDLSDKVAKGQATVSMLAQFLFYSTPQFIGYVIPMATLVAVLATIGGLTRIERAHGDAGVRRQPVSRRAAARWRWRSSGAACCS